MKKIIDTHVHFYTGEDLARIGGNLPYSLPAPHPLKSYLDDLIDQGRKPALINHVHISILPDSENVFRSFEELAELQRQNPARYGGIELVGTIKADPHYATRERLSHPQVKGVRVVLHDTPAEAISDGQYKTAEWQALYARLRPDQHVHVYAKSPAANLKVLRQIPPHISVAIDHLGTCYPENGVQDADFQALLAEAKQRGNVWFKGPGYRTDIAPEAVAPFATEILRQVGADKLVLEASDAPHVGKDDAGRIYADHFTAASAFDFTHAVAEATARETDVDAAALLHGHARDLLPKQTHHRKNEDSMSNETYTEEDITFPVDYHGETVELKGRVYHPKNQSEEQKKLPPLVFNSGYTGGVSMYGQLMGKAMAEKGYAVMTYDVAGFFGNKDVRNTQKQGDKTVTHVSLEDQKCELHSAIEWTKNRFGKMPAVASWAMGATVSLSVVSDLAKQGGEQIPFYVPMNYTSMQDLQNLRADKGKAHADISALPDDAAVSPFDTGTEETRLGYYPLDKDTQAYVDSQLGGYTDVAGVDHWPGCTHVTAASYKEAVAFDAEKDLDAKGNFPPALVVHGADNSLHMPEESARLHRIYPGAKAEQPLMVSGMQHGQQMQTEHKIFQKVTDHIDRGIRTAVGLQKAAPQQAARGMSA